MTGTAIILAGGLGTRLRDRVANLPKPMAPVAGRPFLAYLLDRLLQQGFLRAVLSVGYRADSIVGCFGSAYHGIDLIYSREERPLGTGGAIRQALGYCHESSVLVLNGDTYLELDYQQFMRFHELHCGPISLALNHVENSGRYGAVKLQGDRIVSFNEKGVDTAMLVNAGAYAMRTAIFADYSLPESFSFELDFLAPHCPSLQPYGFRTRDYMIDIGIPADFDRAQVELPQRLLQ